MTVVGVKPHPIFLAGRWVESPDVLEVANPADAAHPAGATYNATPEQYEEAVNAAVAAACSGRFRTLIEFTADPIVSSDVRTSTFSGVFDSLSTMVMEETMVKTITWFNNGWGYSARIIEVLERMAETLTSSSQGVGGKE